MVKKRRIYKSHHINNVHLTSTINNITFTPKELDILACILNGRGTKATGILLSISPKTVEVHTRNIMLKVGCNSRERIINFIEKSTQFLDIKRHYFNILAQKDFISNLREISKVIEKTSISCQMVFWPEYEEINSYVYRLKEDLSAIGIRIDFIQREKNKTIQEILPKRGTFGVDYIFYCIPNILSNHTDNISNNILDDVNYFNKYFKNLEKLSYLSVSDKCFNSINTNSAVSRCIEFEERDGYYQAFYKVVRQINPSLSVDNYNDNSTSTSLEGSYIHFQTQYVSKDGYNQAKHIQNHISEQLTNKKTMSYSVLALICLFLLFSIYQHQNEKRHLFMELKEINTQWLTLYKPHFNEAISLASFYQMRSNALNIDKAREISAEIDKFSFVLNKDLESISDKIDYNKNNVWIINSLNWSLKYKIIRYLEDFRKHILIALSLNQAAKYMRDENFFRCC